MKPDAKRCDAGFTLVELMMVMVIIGLMTSAVVLTLPPKPLDIDRQAQALTVQINQTVEASIISATPAALGVSTDGYVFYTYAEGDWAEGQKQNWSDNLDLELIKNGRALKITDIAAPHIVFQPTGLTAQFTLTLSGSDQIREISSAGTGLVINSGARP